MKVTFPRMFSLIQRTPNPHDREPDQGEQVDAIVGRLLAEVPSSGCVGLAVGSRGIAGLGSLIATCCAAIKARGFTVRILPAMGSHGGATSGGQKQVLASYGVDQEQLACPIDANMETMDLGPSSLGTHVHWSRAASQVDAVVMINRVKPHTDFKGSLGSGLLKMLVVGLGKREGAAGFHRAAMQHGYENVLRAHAEHILRAMPIAGGLAILENARHERHSLHGVHAKVMVEQEEELFKIAAGLMPRLPSDDLDLLIVDQIGKNLSGSGMDPNIIGRGVHGYSTHFAEQPDSPRIKRIMVRDLSAESHGNAIGIGMADFTTSRLVRAMNKPMTFVNAMTAMTLNGAKIPIHFERDDEVIQWALDTLVDAVNAGPRVLRIRDTLNLDFMEASEALLPELQSREEIKILSPLEVMAFNQEGQLKDLPRQAPLS